MADIPPRVPGATGPEPMKKTTGKVAPKKETVRISLPPKPSAAPTIKLPTLPPGGPTGAASTPAAAPGHAPAPAAPAPAPGRAAAPAPARKGAAAPAAQRPSTMQRAAAPVAARPGLSQGDTILAIAAGVVGVIAVASTAYLAFMVLQ